MNIHTMLDLHPADRLGQLRAEIACLEELAELERAKLIALGDGDHNGLLFHAKVSLADRKTVGWQAICKQLGVSKDDEIAKQHTTSKVIITVTVNSRGK